MCWGRISRTYGRCILHGGLDWGWLDRVVWTIKNYISIVVMCIVMCIVVIGMCIIVIGMCIIVIGMCI